MSLFVGNLIAALEVADEIFVEDLEVDEVHIVVDHVRFFIQRSSIRAVDQPLDFNEAGEAVFTDVDRHDFNIRLHANGQPISLAHVKGLFHV